MTADEALQFVKNSIEPRLEEMGESYVVLLENKQYVMVYNGDLIKIAYMLGQVLQEILRSQENNEQAKEYIQSSFIDGYEDKIDGKDREEF
jgi:hypothetical protein